MIHRLHIKGLAIIEELNIEFGDGFNVITGETGAGKSILIKALSFLMGQRVGADVIRNGFDQATVTGEFSLTEGHQAIDFLNRLGIPFESNEGVASLIVRRQINDKGRSLAWVNDVALTHSSLKELSQELVDIFGQHDNQRLMKPEFHLSYLDSFLEDGEISRGFKHDFQEIMENLKELKRTVENVAVGTRDLDYRLFRLSELEEFKPSTEDFQKVKEITESSRKALDLKEGLSGVLQTIEGEGGSVNEILWASLKKLGRLCDKEENGALSELFSKGESLASELDSYVFELNQRLTHLEVDEQAIEEAQSRLFGYQELFRKHGVKEVEALILEYEKLKLETLSREELAERVEKELSSLVSKSNKLSEKAKRLSELRFKAGNKIRKEVEKELRDLAMPGARFDVRWTESGTQREILDLSVFGSTKLIELGKKLFENLEGMSTQGFDEAEFMLASNLGEPLMPLLKIASGGELSRIMLALKKALVADADTCVLVFDEIDTGISGRVADVVGQKMKSLSDAFQVLCISHLPQVAVYADAHFLVKKEAKTGSKKQGSVRTESMIVRLSREESTSEIARLLSGSEVSRAGLENARALLDKARKKTKKSDHVTS